MRGSGPACRQAGPARTPCPRGASTSDPSRADPSPASPRPVPVAGLSHVRTTTSRRREVFKSTALHRTKPTLPSHLMGLSFDTEGEPAGGGGAGADGGAEGGEGAPTPGADGGTEDQPEPKVFDEAYVKQLRDEAASYRTKLRETEAKYEGAKTPDEVEAITRELRDTIAAYERENARREAAEAAGLPLSFAGRLQGETAEELLAD